MPDVDSREGAAIILEGSINPAIFTPVWLKTQTLVDEADARDAVVEFIDPDLSRFDIAHFRVEARRDRVTVASDKELETYFPLTDFVEGILDVLCHTPIRAVSMSRVAHVALPPGGWATLARTMIPADPWSGIVPDPALQVLSVVGRRSTDDSAQDRRSTVEVSIEESVLIEGGMYAVATERVEVEDPKITGRGALDALDALKRWPSWLIEANRIVERIKALA